MSSGTCRVSVAECQPPQRVPTGPDIPLAPQHSSPVSPNPSQPPLPAGYLCPPAPAAPPCASLPGFLFHLRAEIPRVGNRELRGWAGCPGRAVPAHPRRPAETIGELNRGYREQNRPVTDGSRELHSLCAQLEFLLQVAPEGN